MVEYETALVEKYAWLSIRLYWWKSMVEYETARVEKYAWLSMRLHWWKSMHEAALVEKYG